MKFISLYRKSYRWIGLAIALAGIVILGILMLCGFSYVENWEEKIFIINHFVIIAGFMIMTYSREKDEDERIQDIRAWSLRSLYLLTVFGIIMYAAVTILDRAEFSLYVVFYIMEATLILNQVAFRLFLRFNPSWIFRESKRHRIRNIVPVVSLVFLIGWVNYCAMKFKV
jgi:hypothetical protein